MRAPAPKHFLWERREDCTIIRSRVRPETYFTLARDGLWYSCYGLTILIQPGEWFTGHRMDRCRWERFCAMWSLGRPNWNRSQYGVNKKRRIKIR